MILIFEKGDDPEHKTSENSDAVESGFRELVYPERIEQENSRSRPATLAVPASCR